mmetsp:Transcript_13873/g.38369  ORF Transcript_13873/g.38369 Transcript_13873/m.38369 type:complete len:346 (-) Transcript_13873:2270-3307(-)
MTSITSTTPTTVPSSSHTGRVRNLLSCMTCRASRTEISGETASGSGVMTVSTVVDSSGNSLATARVIMSLKPKIPISFPSSTIKEAFLFSVMIAAASRMDVDRSTIVLERPANKLRRVGVDDLPKACDIKLPRRACSAAVWAALAPCWLTACMTASSAALSDFSDDFSSLSIASLRHLAMSRIPTMVLLSLTTGKCLKWFSTMIESASIADSPIVTHVGFGVMTSLTHVVPGSTSFATTLLVTSVSVRIPTRPPVSPTRIAAFPRRVANICATERTLSSWGAESGLDGRKCFTVLLLEDVTSKGCFCTAVDLAGVEATDRELPSTVGSFATRGTLFTETPSRGFS